MTRDEAEQIVVTVEVGMSEHYGITRSQYLQALAIIQEDEASKQNTQADLLPCGHPKSSLVQLRFGSLQYCKDCKRASSHPLS